jgi:hypothetical protein
MQSNFITLDDLQNMRRERERAERRAQRRAERQEMEEMREQQISLLKQQLEFNEEVKRQQQVLKDEQKEAKRIYKQMVAESPLLTLEELLYNHTDSPHLLPRRPLEIRSTSATRVVDDVVDGLLEEVETLEALDFYDTAMSRTSGGA